MRPKTFKTLIKQCNPLIPALLLGVLCLQTVCCRIGSDDRPYVATVNGEKIFLEEFQKQLEAQKTRLSPQDFSNAPDKQALLENEILESMITEKIICQRARELNLSVSNSELERKIIAIRDDYGINFFDLLARENVQYDEWRESIRKEMLFDKLVAVDINAAIRVSEDEAEDYLNDHPDLCKTESRVRASQIVVRDMEKARGVTARLERGEDFAKVAAEVSIGPEAVRGGDLGFVARQTMPDPLDKTLFNLPVGKISPVIQSVYGYHIVKVTEIQASRTRSFTECKEEIIAEIRAQKEDAAFSAWLDALKLKAVVKKETGVHRKTSP